VEIDARNSEAVASVASPWADYISQDLFTSSGVLREPDDVMRRTGEMHGHPKPGESDSDCLKRVKLFSREWAREYFAEVSVGDMKQGIATVSGIPVDEQRIVHRSRSVGDEVLVTDLFPSLQSWSLPILLLVRSERLSISAQAAGRPRIALSVRSTDLVEEVKAQIRDKEGIPVEDQQLFFGWQELPDDWTLFRCRIQKGFTVHIGISSQSVPGPFTKTSAGDSMDSSISVVLHDLNAGTIREIQVRPRDSMRTLGL
jgi:hypothetical protein